MISPRGADISPASPAEAADSTARAGLCSCRSRSACVRSNRSAPWLRSPCRGHDATVETLPAGHSPADRLLASPAFFRRLRTICCWIWSQSAPTRWPSEVGPGRRALGRVSHPGRGPGSGKCSAARSSNLAANCGPGCSRARLRKSCSANRRRHFSSFSRGFARADGRRGCHAVPVGEPGQGRIHDSARLPFQNLFWSLSGYGGGNSSSIWAGGA